MFDKWLCQYYHLLEIGLIAWPLIFSQNKPVSLSWQHYDALEAVWFINKDSEKCRGIYICGSSGNGKDDPQTVLWNLKPRLKHYNQNIYFKHRSLIICFKQVILTTYLTESCISLVKLKVPHEIPNKTKRQNQFAYA